MTPAAHTAPTNAARSADMTDRTARVAPTSITITAGKLAAAILLLACGFHAFWAAGGEWGAATAYGSPQLPPQAATAVIAVLIGCAALLLLARIGVLAMPLPRWMLRVGTWVLVAVFALAGVTNLIQTPDAYARDWHIYFFGPLLLTLAALCAIAERSIPGR
ncbi:MAG: hypothetical protein AVDCRST_MAG67-784 [uncultured Solirubrobacteraceae bacterium]|uniref:DUF3995 domain-containing protein n=1 Tax=uncultured Solirubrobacteraceae bacterium TaxID=1162706 RepID=A0A6J4RSF3_9ACTN|nr:MAG: hypothetical protein AVDCRST_MAG67-784 [uncultured Solirubrobacteraceae bacterium]